MTPAVETRRMIEKRGIQVPLLTGGSTGTYNIDPEIAGIDEHQPGSFLFMDIDYNRIGGADGSATYQDFANSLTVLTTVVSKPEDAVAIVDGGLKAFSTDKPFTPKMKGDDSVTYAYGGDEHGRLSGALSLKLGDRREFIIPHCDPTVNLYDRMFACRGDNVEAVWQVAARGMSQ
jgi:D-serine deaminase-like pyridoxal phosphate-dependent protein